MGYALPIPLSCYSAKQGALVAYQGADIRKQANLARKTGLIGRWGELAGVQGPAIPARRQAINILGTAGTTNTRNGGSLDCHSVLLYRSPMTQLNQSRSGSISPLQVTYRIPESLKPDPRNARTHSTRQVDQIVASIREFGFTNPIPRRERRGN